MALALWAGLYRSVAASPPAPAAPATSAATTSAASQPAHFVILHINDVHGQTQPRNENGKSVGGYARLATLAAQVRTEKGLSRVLMVHSGDEISRGDDLTESTGGKANIAILNKLGLDILTPGNGEYYNGPAALQGLIGLAKFPVLTANVTDRWTGKPLSPATSIVRVGEYRVAFLGLCFVRTQLPSAWGLKVEDPIAAAKRLVPDLRKQADMVIVVSHIGVDQDEKLAQEVGGIDLILGGHTHTLLPEGKRSRGPDKREVLICQSNEFLKYCGRVDVELQPAAGGGVTIQAKVKEIPLNEAIKIDPTMTAFIAKLAEATTRPAKDKAKEPASAPAGVID